jgi:hypothetical protein
MHGWGEKRKSANTMRQRRDTMYESKQRFERVRSMVSNDARKQQSLHPQTELARTSSRGDPIQCRMELSHGRHRCDSIPTQLGQLLTLPCIYVDKTVHVTNAKALHTVLRELLPLGS